MQDAVEALKARHDFSSWAGRIRTRERILVRNLAFRAGVAPGWELVRQERREVPGLPACTESFWKSPRGPGSLVRVDSWECDSALAAHEFLMHLLTHYESPLVDRRDDIDIGDVTFAPPGAAALLFARANLVIGVTRASQVEEPVTDLARRFDEDAIARPEADEAMSRAASAAVESVAPAVVERVAGGQFRMRLDVAPRADNTVKVFAEPGDLRVERGQIVYQPESGSEPTVTVYDIDPEGRAARRVVRLERDSG